MFEAETSSSVLRAWQYNEWLHLIRGAARGIASCVGRCDPAHALRAFGYAELVDRIRGNIGKRYMPERAAKLAIDNCIADGIMPDLLRKERARMTKFPGGVSEIEDLVRERYGQQKYEEGRFDGVDRLIANGGYSSEEACRILDLSVESYYAYKEKQAEG